MDGWTDGRTDDGPTLVRNYPFVLKKKAGIMGANLKKWSLRHSIDYYMRKTPKIAKLQLLLYCHENVPIT